MDLTLGLEDLVAVALVAALAPLVVAVLPGPRIPQIAVFLPQRGHLVALASAALVGVLGLDVVLGALPAGWCGAAGPAG